MKNTYEVNAEPGQELTFEQLERFVQQVRERGAGAMGTRVKAKVRFNGTLRGLSVEVHDQPILGQRTGSQSVTDSTVGGNVTQIRGTMNTAADDAWLAQQW